MNDPIGAFDIIGGEEMGRLQEKVALITGGGTGIGRATSLLFAEEGANIVVGYSRSKPEAERTVSDIQKRGQKGVAVCADISDDSAVKSMVGEVTGRFGKLDILVNNAGTTQFIDYKDLDELTEDVWDRILAVNLKGTFFCCRAAIQAMKMNGGGQIINVSSTSGYTGQGSCIPYAVSKAAIINLTRGLAVSHAPDIRVNAVAPGVVETRWIDGFDQKFSDKRRAETPLKRLAKPEDVALSIFGLAINEFITGKTVVVDGGRTLF